MGSSGNSRTGGLIGLVEPRRVGIFAAFVIGCSEGRLPGVVVSALRFFAVAFEEGSTAGCGNITGVVEVDVTAAGRRGVVTIVGVLLIISDISALTGAISLVGVEITEGVLSATATDKGKQFRDTYIRKIMIRWKSYKLHTV